MKPRSLFVMLLLCFASAIQAQITVNVFINGTRSGQYIIKEDQNDGGIWYKKTVYKNMNRLSIEVKGKMAENDFYKKNVEVTDDKDNPLFTAPETGGVKGQFVLTDKAIKKRLSKGKMIKLYLQMDPSDPRSKAPSRRIFIGNLTAK